MNNEYLTDTHFHLELTDDIDQILENARKNGVGNFIISGCDLKGIEEGLEIIKKYENIYLTIGIHPDEMKDFDENTLSYLEKLIEDGRIDKYVKEKYSSWNSELGERIRDNKTSLEELTNYATQLKEAEFPGSGRQEYLEGIVNNILFK